VREEKLNDDLIHEDAMSYYLDYYLPNTLKEILLSLSYNSGWNKELNELIEGLTLIGIKAFGIVPTAIKKE
jgi:hypothetical protein